MRKVSPAGTRPRWSPIRTAASAVVAGAMGLGALALPAPAGISSQVVAPAALAAPAPAERSTTLTASPSGAAEGDAVTFTATVTCDAAPTGTVTFVDGNGIVLGTNVVDANGIATYTISTLAVGDHQITASYSGDANCPAEQSTPVAFTVVQRQQDTTTSIASSTQQAVEGEVVTFTATVIGATEGTIPAGTVEFVDASGNVLGTAQLDQNGQANWAAALAPGEYSVSARYLGDEVSASSQSAQTVVSVSQAVRSTTTTLTVSPEAITQGEATTLSAAVDCGGAAPTGDVTFYDLGTPIATVPLDANGVAAVTSTAFGAGDHSITAVYAGAGNCQTSSSSAIALSVAEAEPVEPAPVPLPVPVEPTPEPAPQDPCGCQPPPPCAEATADVTPCDGRV